MSCQECREDSCEHSGSWASSCYFLSTGPRSKALAHAHLYLLPPFIPGSDEEGGKDLDSHEAAMEALLEAEYPADPIFADTTRSRYTSKSRQPCFLAPGYTALGLNAGKPCRLSRELGATFYCKNWEARRNKLAVLYPLRFEGHECRVPPLQVIIGREDGHTHTYYSSEPLQSSPSAVWMLHASDSKQKAYSRLPLLLTPSTSLQFPKDSRQP